MKKQILMLLFIPVQAIAQNPSFPVINISVPCTDQFINSYKGKWLIHDPKLNPTSVNDYHDEVIKRLNQMQNLVYELYPQPVGSDATWSGGFTKSSFADEVKFELGRNDEWDQHAVIRTPVYCCRYNLILFAMVCNGEKQITDGYPGASLSILSNGFQILGDFSDGPEWMIDGLRIKQKMPTVGTWKGFDVMSPTGAEYDRLSSSHTILISRPGMLPYIPVTRKQYLERAIQYTTHFYDEVISKTKKSNDALPAQIRSSQEDIDNLIAHNTKAKNDALQKFHDELQRTTKDGLLDAPGVVRIDPLLQSEGPVFLPESEGGYLLAIENPNYFRKDLPKYVPQFFVVELGWSDKAWARDFRRTIEENFPIEKLQGMIDK